MKQKDQENAKEKNVKIIQNCTSINEKLLLTLVHYASVASSLKF